MTAMEAKRLSVDERVVLLLDDKPPLWGIVLKKYYNSITVKYDGDLCVVYNTLDMLRVFTQEQLDRIETDKRLVQKIKEHNEEKAKQGPYVWPENRPKS